MNTYFLPLAQDFHPAYLAAAYLSIAKRDLESNAAMEATAGLKAVSPETIKSLPEEIGGHPWFMFVDPAIERAQLDYVTGAYDGLFNIC